MSSRPLSLADLVRRVQLAQRARAWTGSIGRELRSAGFVPHSPLDGGASRRASAGRARR